MPPAPNLEVGLLEAKTVVLQSADRARDSHRDSHRPGHRGTLLDAHGIVA